VTVSSIFSGLWTVPTHLSLSSSIIFQLACSNLPESDQIKKKCTDWMSNFWKACEKTWQVALVHKINRGRYSLRVFPTVRSGVGVTSENSRSSDWRWTAVTVFKHYTENWFLLCQFSSLWNATLPNRKVDAFQNTSLSRLPPKIDKTQAPLFIQNWAYRLSKP